MSEPHRALRRALVLACLLLTATGGAAQTGSGRLAITGADVQQKANFALSLLQFSLTPDVTTSSLSINNAGTGNPGYSVTQLGGGDTVYGPLYLEGNLAFSRYDPVFAASAGSEQRLIPVKWNSAAATGGVGWDVPVAKDLKFRPIFLFSLGTIASDLKLAETLLEIRSDRELNFLDGGSLDAYGLGGSLMLDYEHVRPEYEIDVEARLNAVQLKSFNTKSDSIQANYLARAFNVWARWRAPTGYTVMDRPLRYVLENTISNYLGSEGDTLGFNWLVSFGAGIEFDSSKYDIIVTRTRLVLRYCRGNNVEGTSLGIAVSF